MLRAFQAFEERRAEIELFLSAIKKLNDSEDDYLATGVDELLLKIMKSNFLLMLYNLVESCIVLGMTEIYEDVRNDGCSYMLLVKEIKDTWSRHRIDQIYNQATDRKAYHSMIKNIIDVITNEKPIALSKEILAISGNLDAKKITDICDNHKIRYSLRITHKDGNALKTVKDSRDKLAHGGLSFGTIGKNYTVGQLDDIKNHVLGFLEDIMRGMKEYYDNKAYKSPQRTSA